MNTRTVVPRFPHSRNPSAAGEASSSAGGAAEDPIPMAARFIEMGFSAEKVAVALEKHRGGGRDAEDSTIVEWLLTAADETDQEEFSSSSEDFDIAEFETENEVLSKELSEKDRKFLSLVEMGFTEDEVSSAISICGQDESVLVLADAIYAAQVDKKDRGSGGASVSVEFSASEVMGIGTARGIKRRMVGPSSSGSMVGFYLPNEVMNIYNRKLPDIAEGPPYFYFENEKMSRSLYGIEPEFIDWKYFCSVTKKRWYVHNLPVHGRLPLLPMQKTTIQDAFSLTSKWWPWWDKRTHLSGMQILRSPTAPAKKVMSMLAACGGTPLEDLRKKIIDECRKGNLIWITRNIVSAVELSELECLMGFPRDHTRDFNMTDRYCALWNNTFQVDTVAYHLSVLKSLFPDGVRVMSLFSNLGGAEVALARLKLPIKVLVSLETSDMNRVVLKSWWEESDQMGELVQICDVDIITNRYLETLVRKYGGFDLIIGGRPCNNIDGGNSYNLELEGEQFVLFCARVLEQVRQIMRRL